MKTFLFALWLGSLAFTSGLCVGGVDNVKCFNMISGDTFLKVGKVCASIIDDQLNIVYDLTELLDGSTPSFDYKLDEVHLWAGLFPESQVPSGTGNYLFATPTGLHLDSYIYSVNVSLDPWSFKNGKTTVNVAMPTIDCITDLGPGYVNIVAHAKILLYSNGVATGKDDSATSAGIVFEHDWWSYSTVPLSCDCTNGAVEIDTVCDSAFGQSVNNECFINMTDVGTFTTQRWGWSNCGIENNGKVHTLIFYAGAGRCDITKGVIVGKAAFHYDYDGNLTFELAGQDGWSFTDMHIYAGTRKLPQVWQGKTLVYTVAPGRYPEAFTDDKWLTEGTVDFTLSPVPSPICVLFHSVVCKEVPME